MSLLLKFPIPRTSDNLVKLHPKFLISKHLFGYKTSHMGSTSRQRDHNVITMALVEQMSSCAKEATIPHHRILAYELVQGEMVKLRSVMEKSLSDLPTAVILHGILGNKNNWGSFVKRLAKEFPTWQFLLVDLRCHGDSSSLIKMEPPTVASAAGDVLKLVRQLKITPRVLVGHSFGGKVALSMVDQAAKPFARPVNVWVLDATPGIGHGGNVDDHPAELISFLRTFPSEVSSKKDVLDALARKGFSRDVAQWVVTNLRCNSRPGSSKKFSWVFDLKGISKLYRSYEETNLWGVVEDVPLGVHLNFLKAERSLHRWTPDDLRRIHAVGDGGVLRMHLLKDAGHWVHTDNPDGLFRIISSSFRPINI